MTTASPAFTFTGAAGSLQKKATTAGGTVVATLDDIAGVTLVQWAISSTDETSVPGDFSLALSGAKNSICTITGAGMAAAKAGMLQCTVNSGVDPQTGDPSDRMSARAKFHVPTAAGLEVACFGEEDESSDDFWWVGIINAAIRYASNSVASLGVTAPIVNTGTATAPVVGISAATALAAGSYPAGHFTAVQNRTSAPTVSTMVERDAAGRFQAVDPSAAQDVATMAHVGHRSFFRARLNPTANIANLSAASLTQDGTTVELNNLLLLTEQADSTQNGLYYASAVGATATLTRAPGATAGADFLGMVVQISGGSDRFGRVYRFEQNVAPTMGVSGISYVRAPDVANFVALAYSEAVTYNVGGITDLNWPAGRMLFISLTGNTTLSFSGGKSGVTYVLMLQQDGTGGRTITWPADVLFKDGESGAPDATANKMTLYQFHFTQDIYFATKDGPYTP
jgi:hypothetical protein